MHCSFAAFGDSRAEKIPRPKFDDRKFCGTCPVIRLSRNLLISPFKSRNRPGQVPGTSDASKTQSGLIRWDEKAGLHGMRYAPRIDVLYAQEKETGDEED